MGIALSFGTDVAITAHDASGLALLLSVQGTEVSTMLAAKLELECAALARIRETITLTDSERVALRETLDLLRTDRLPRRINALHHLLSLDP
jgi:hypothetical protein